MKRLVAIESPMSAVASSRGVDEIRRARPARLANRVGHVRVGHLQVGILGEAARGRDVGVDHRARRARLHLRDRLVGSRDDHVAAEHHASPRPRRCAPRGSPRACAAMRMCEYTEPPFCARPVMSSTAAPLPSMCAAMPSSAPMVTTPVPPTPVTRMPYGRVERRQRRLRQRAEHLLHDRLLLAQLPALDRHEARAEALHARVVLVARALVDGALAAELGLDRHHRQAIGLHAAIAAAFAHQLVDDDALGGIGELAALAAAALLGGAGLVVDEDRRARNLAQLALHRVEVVAMVHRRARREIRARRRTSPARR